MKIALAGYGKMGREVEFIARTRGHEITGIYDEYSGFKLLSPEALKKQPADVIIDFTQPDAVVTNVRVAAKAKIPIVIGTTGWEKERAKIKNMVDEGAIACVSASNFSIGVNLFFKIVHEASRLLNTADYDVYINEAHHSMKKDFPSGTALRISEEILSAFTTKTRVQSVLKQGEAPSREALIISSVRSGNITGEHTVGFESEEDSIELKHSAKSRRGFALGAVRAAEWTIGKKGMFRFEEHLEEILENRI